MTTGTFDGVHLGHRKILEVVKRLAQERDGESVLFSFYPHPRMVLYPDDHGLQLLHTREEKYAALQSVGIDHLVEVPFTKEFSEQSAEDYVITTFIEGIGLDTMVIGYDHRFGRSREGDIRTLRRMSKAHGFTVHEIPPQVIDSVNVSSTKVRRYLSEGAVHKAAKALGDQYTLSGEVVQGNRIGRTIGFPTANIQVGDPNKLVPGNGVYEVRVLLGERRFKGMVNIGYRPTVDKVPVNRTIEVHVIDLDQDIYGENLSLRFIRQIRAERMFSSLEALKQQLQKDLHLVLKGD